MARGRVFPNEIGLSRGSDGAGVEELQRYLARFGYLASDDPGGYGELPASIITLPVFRRQPRP